MNNQYQLIIILIAFLLPLLSWIFNKLREQYEITRIERDRQRRREESLRTGRGIEDSPRSPAASAEPRSLAERRQAQLRQLREQQAARQRTARPTVIVVPPAARPTAAGPGPGGVRRTAQPTRPPVRPARPGGAPSPAARPAPQSRRPQTPRPAAPARPARPGRHADARTAPPLDRRRDTPPARPISAPEAVSTGSGVQRLVSDAEQAPKKSSPPVGRALALATVPRGVAGWRRVILMSEILARPVALRAESEQPGV